MKRLILIFVSIFSIVFATQATTYTVISNADGGAGSLRQALALAAGDGAVPHTIIFSSAMTITLNTSLALNADPELNGLTINGFVDGTAGSDVIIRSNSLCGVRGFDINGSITNLKFYGLVFQNVEYGIFFNANASATANGSQIKGCYFGTDLTGAAIQNGICKSGITFIGVSSAIIGGINTNLSNGTATSSNNSERCLFGGTCLGNGAGDNGRYGAIQLQNGSNNVSILNNYIGVNLAGTTVLPIGNATNKKPVTQNGIAVDGTPSFNVIISNNVISGAFGSGISIFTGDNAADASSGHIITGNIIGLDATGTLGYNVTTPANSFGNQASGIYIRNASNVTIGGSTAATRNVISANGGAAHTWPNPSCFAGWNDYNQIAVYLEYCVSTKVSGNYIGTNSTGTSSGIGTNNILGNRSGGIKIVGGLTGSNNNIIGGSNAGEGNVISGNGYLWGTFTAAPCPGSGVLSNISTGHGIVLQYADCKNTSILGNYIGLTADGVTGLGNFTSGIDIQGAVSTTIGGPSADARNYVCANQFGITIQEDFDPASHNVATGTIVAGNYIGLNKNSVAVGNGVSASFTEGAGIVIQKGANLNTIGTAVAGGGNVISGNRSGIIIRNAEGAGSNTGSARNNTIQNNIIGLDPTGLSAIPNTSATAGYGYGIQIEVGIGSATTTIPFGNIIGGTGANQANTISSNQKSGILITSGTAVTASIANSIIGNKIGTNAAGTGDFGNPLQGIEIVNVSNSTITSNVISGNDQNGISLTGTTTNTIESNTITANAVNGIFLSGSSSNTIQGNTISSNTSNGISVTAISANNIIGGIASGEANTINTNGANGVFVDGAGSINNSIHENSFSCNTLRGIVLSNGSNNNIKTATILGTPLQLVYTNPNAFATRIEIFETDGCASCPADPTRLQGKTFITSGNLTAGGTFTFTTALGFSSTKLYTAILHQGTNVATTAARNTSEFTICYTLCANPPAPGITGVTTLCEGTTGATFAVSSVNAGSTYSWTVPTGVTITAGASTPSITVTIGPAPITGNVIVTETAVGGCTGSGNAALTIKAKPTLVSAGTTQNLCSATSATLTGSVLPSGTTGAWSVLPSGPTFTNGTSASATANGLTPGTNYTFTWAVTNAPCAAVTASSTVNNAIKPTPSITGTTTLCEGTTGASFNTASVAGNTYTWTSPTGTTIASGSGTAAITVTIGPAPVTGNVSVTESSSATCSTTANAALTIKAKPTSVSAGTTQNLCSATSVNLTGSTHAGTTGAWSVLPSGPTFTNGTSASTTANGLTPGTNYAFTWAVTNAPCAAVTASSTVNNAIKPTPSITGTTTLCEGTTSASFNTASVAGHTYTWTSPTGTTIASGAGTAAITVNIGPAPVTGNVSVTESSSATCSATANAALTIKAKPTSVSAGTTQNLCSATSVNLTGSTHAGTTGAWSVLPSGPTFTNGTSASTTANGLTPGTNYTFTWSVTNAPCAAVSNSAAVNNAVKPTPSITGTTTLCEGTTGASFNTASVTGNSYSWTLPTGVSGSSTSSSITVAIGNAPITGNISVTESSSPTCSTTATAALTIKDQLTNVSAGTDKSVCAAASVALTGSTLPSGTTGVWTVNPSAGITFVDATSPTTNANGLANATDYTFTWSVTNAPCEAVKSTVVISNKPQPTVSNAGADKKTCNTSDVTLSGNAPTIGTGAWSVLPNSGISFDNASSPTAKASGLSAGTVYTFTWSITNAPCTASTSTVKVERTNLATPIIDGGGAHCSSLTATLTVNPSNVGSTYVWDVVNGDATITSSTTVNPVTVNSGSAGGTIRVKESNGGCTMEGTASITISPVNSIADAGINFSTCIGAAKLTGNVPVYGTGSWSVVLPSTAVVTPGTTSNIANATFLIDGNIYKFVYTVSGACGLPKKDTVEVAAGLIGGFDVTASGPSDTLCVNTSRTLSANVTGTGGSGKYTYIWVSSDGSFTSSDTISNVAVKPVGQETTYTVYVLDNLNTGCKTNIANVKIHAVESQDLNIPNLITPNGDHKNDIFILKDKVTGMDIIKEGSHIEVVNRWGSKMYEANNYENNWVPKDLTDGMYYYHITSSCGNKEYKSWLQILGNTNN